MRHPVPLEQKPTFPVEPHPPFQIKGPNRAKLEHTEPEDDGQRRKRPEFDRLKTSGGTPGQ